MARQKGIFLIHGSIGNVRNYQVTGEKYITSALKGGPTVDQINTLPQFDWLRKHNREWSGVQLAVHNVKLCLDILGSRYFDSHVTGRIVQKMVEIQYQDFDEPFGKRYVSMVFNGINIYSLVLNPTHKLAKVSNINFQNEHSLPTSTATLSFQNGPWSDLFKFKNAETHVRVINGIFYVPNVMYNDANFRYDNESGGVTPGARFTVGDWIERGTSSTGTTSIVTDIADLAGYIDTALIVQVAIIEFSQLVNGVYGLTSNFAVQLINFFNPS